MWARRAEIKDIHIFKWQWSCSQVITKTLKGNVSAVRNQNDGLIYLIYLFNCHSTTAKLDKESKDRCVLSLKWNNQGAIRKHNRNILLHIEVKSYTTRGRLWSVQKQGRPGCSLTVLATLLKKHREQCRTLCGNRTAMETFRVKYHLCCTISEIQFFFWEGGGVLISCSSRTYSAVKPCTDVVMAPRLWLNGKLAFSLPGWQPCAGLPL